MVLIFSFIVLLFSIGMLTLESSRMEEQKNAETKEASTMALSVAAPVEGMLTQKALVEEIEVEEKVEVPIQVAFSDTIQVMVTEEQKTTIEQKVEELEPEIVMLAKLILEEAEGVKSTAQQAAVAWCVFNRVDSGEYSTSIAKVIKQPAQFAWNSHAKVKEHLYLLAKDVTTRWLLEKEGFTDVGRTLPKDYLFFGGNGKVNRFRLEYDTKSKRWNWSLPDPYDS